MSGERSSPENILEIRPTGWLQEPGRLKQYVCIRFAPEYIRFNLDALAVPQNNSVNLDQRELALLANVFRYGARYHDYRTPNFSVSIRYHDYRTPNFSVSIHPTMVIKDEEQNIPEYYELEINIGNVEYKETWHDNDLRAVGTALMRLADFLF